MSTATAPTPVDQVRTAVEPDQPVARRVADRIGRPLVAGALAAVIAGGGVLLAAELAGEEYEGRVSLVAGPVAGGGAAQYGEVVSFTLPALAELARSPSVLATAAADTGGDAAVLADAVSVELVPASGLARLTVRVPSRELAGDAATAIARAMIKADLLAPAAALRVLDQRPDVIQVSPDRPLGLGLALAASAATGVAVGSLRHLRRTSAEAAVRAALSSRPPVVTLRAATDDLTERLARLCVVAGRPPRVLAVNADAEPTARALENRLTRRLNGDLADPVGLTASTLVPRVAGEPVLGDAVVAVTRGGRRQDQLATVAALLPESSVLIAVVLA